MECRDERESIPIFIHSALDDAGLTVYGFRLYCRIARRAGSGGECYETMPNMAEGCNMTRKRATKALRELESRGMVRIDAEPGKAKRITLTPKARWTTPGENAQGGRAKSPEGGRAKSPDEGTPTKGTPLKESAASAAREDLDFVPERHAYLKEEIRQNVDAFTSGSADPEMLARRLLKRGRQPFPKTVIAGHVRDHPPERFIAAWTIAASSAQSNPTKYANTILKENFRDTDTPKRRSTGSGDGGDDVGSGPDGRMGQWGEYA